MNIYDYVLVRFVPDLTAGEYANIGVVAYNRDTGRVAYRLTEHVRRFSEFFGGIDSVRHRRLVTHLENRLLEICRAIEAPSFLEPTPDSIRGVLAQVIPATEGCFQFSDVMSGVVDGLEERADELFDEFVLRFDRPERKRRDDAVVRREVIERLTKAGLAAKVQHGVKLVAADYEHEFPIAWKNGTQHVLEPISFDLVSPDRIVEKANIWTGRLFTLRQGAPFGFHAVVAPPSEPAVERAFDRALKILGRAPNVQTIAIETNVGALLDRIRQDTDSPYSSTSAN